MKISSAPLVGAHFRPPAKAILQHLPAGAELRLEREPENPYDASAIKVIVRSALIPESQYAELEIAVQGHGLSLDEVLSQSEHHLGYIAAKSGESKALAPELDRGTMPKASLGFDMKGNPSVILAWEPASGTP